MSEVPLEGFDAAPNPDKKTTLEKMSGSCEMCFNFKDFNEVDDTICLIVIVKIMLRSEAHCQKSSKLKHIPYDRSYHGRHDVGAPRP